MTWPKGIEGTFLRGKLSRKVLLLVLGGAFLPLVVIAAVGYRHLNNQLYDQAWDRLRQTSKLVGLGILGRLDMAEATLRTMGELCTVTLECGLSNLEASSAAKGLTDVLLHRQGERSVLMGDLFQPPVLRPDRTAHLRTGRALLIDGPEGPAGVLLAVAVDTADLNRGVVWARLDPGVLILGPEPESEARIAAATCVFDEQQQPIFCPQLAGRVIASSLLRAHSTRSLERLEWTFGGDDTYLAGVWRTFLAWRFGAGDWIVVVSEPKEGVFASVKRQQPMILLLLALAGTLVFFLSNLIVRQRLDPISQLESMTRKVADGDFSVRLELKSGDELETLSHSFNQMTERLGSQFETLKAVAQIDRAILSTLDEQAILTTTVTSAAGAVNAPIVSFARLFSDEAADRGVYVYTAATEELRRLPCPALSSRERRELSRPVDWIQIDLGGETRSLLESADFEEHASIAVMFPVRDNDEAVGVLNLGFSEPGAPTATDLETGRQLADQVSVALQNARLLSELDRLSWGTLTALARKMDAKSEWTAGHSERVTHFALKVGQKLGLPEKDLVTLQQGALLHDIGKMGVPATVLDKPDKLETEEEQKAIRAHVRIGVRILEPIASLENVIPIVRHHHERWDGTGYPDGLAGGEIPLLARIIAAVDVFDALTSPRPYRPAWPIGRALAFIREHRGTHFDPRVADVLTDAITEGLAEEEPRAWESIAAG